MTEQYKPFLIKKLKSGSVVRDSKEWGIWIKSIPFKLFPDVKDIPSRSWNDQHGDDEFIPDSPFFKAYETDCQFVYVGDYGTANTNIKSFLTYLANDGMFQIYDTYTKIGRTKVRYVSYSEDTLYRRDGKSENVVFKVKLKINDPITDIQLVKA